MSIADQPRPGPGPGDRIAALWRDLLARLYVGWIATWGAVMGFAAAAMLLMIAQSIFPKLQTALPNWAFWMLMVAGAAIGLTINLQDRYEWSARFNEWFRHMWSALLARLLRGLLGFLLIAGGIAVMVLADDVGAGRAAVNNFTGRAGGRLLFNIGNVVTLSGALVAMRALLNYSGELQRALASWLFAYFLILMTAHRFAFPNARVDFAHDFLQTPFFWLFWSVAGIFAAADITQEYRQARVGGAFVPTLWLKVFEVFRAVGGSLPRLASAAILAVLAYAVFAIPADLGLMPYYSVNWSVARTICTVIGWALVALAVWFAAAPFLALFEYIVRQWDSLRAQRHVQAQKSHGTGRLATGAEIRLAASGVGRRPPTFNDLKF